MANTDTLLSLDLCDRHIPGALALVQEAGWNQSAQDWRMMIAAGRAYGFEDENNRLVASGVALPYGPRIGWIGMILVTADWQRRGLATGLIDRAVAMLEAAGLMACLDATPAGEQVYLKQGFVPVFSFHRWYRRETATEHGPVPQMTQSEISAAKSLDYTAFGGDRGPLIGDVCLRGGPCEVDPEGTAFALSRAGRVAHQIGPIVAPDEAAALGLFERMQARLTAPVLIDIPDVHGDMIARAKAAGFTRQRPFKRMVRGAGKLNGPEAMFALFGPELG